MINGKNSWTAGQVEESLRMTCRILERGVGSLSEMMKLTEGVARTLLEAALEPDELAELFPEVVLRENGLIEGVYRLRKELNGHWVQVITGRKNVGNEVEEVYDYLRLVRFPSVAFRILQKMSKEPVEEIAALTAEQYRKYNELKVLALQVLENATTILGEGCAAALMKIAPYDLRAALGKSEF